MRRQVIQVCITLIGLTALLFMFLSMGFVHSGLLVKLYLVVCGLVLCQLFLSWLRQPNLSAAGYKPTTQTEVDDESQPDWHPVLAEIDGLSSRLQLGSRHAVDYQRLVRPRLAALARTRLARHGIAIDDADHAQAILGPCYHLVDPLLARLPGNAGPIDAGEISYLVAILEGL